MKKFQLTIKDLETGTVEVDATIDAICGAYHVEGSSPEYSRALTMSRCDGKTLAGVFKSACVNVEYELDKRPVLKMIVECMSTEKKEERPEEIFKKNSSKALNALEKISDTSSELLKELEDDDED